MIDYSEPLQKFISSHDPLVSVVVPSYKKAPYLREAVESVLAQEYRNFEVLIVNDGSPDNTSEVAQKLIQDYPGFKIELLNKQNGGVSDARNHGLRHARGRLVMTMDGDDKIKPQYLRRAVECLRQSGANLFCGIQENFGTQPGEWVPHPYDRFFIRYDNCFPTPSIYDKLLFEKTGGFKVALGYAEDWEYWVNCSRYDLKVHRVEEKLTCYRFNDDGIQSSFIDGKYQDCVGMVAISNEDLFPVEEVLSAHGHFPKSADANIRRVRQLHDLYPKEWISKLLVGILAEHEGNIQEAMNHYWASVENCHNKNWQPLFRLAAVLDAKGQKSDAAQLYHAVRTLRPDMGKFTTPRIMELSKAS